MKTATEELPDFSLILGGPLYQLLRRAHLQGPICELLKRRIFFFIGVTWLPILILSLLDGRPPGIQNPSFLYDIELHVRFLIAVPLLVIAEPVVHWQLQSLFGIFLKRNIISPEDQPEFFASIDAALKTRNSIFLELALFIFAFVASHLIWTNRVADGTLLSLWYVYISIPICQFLFLRWYFRLIIWFRLLWQTSRLKLYLVPIHPDAAGGIGFLGKSAQVFAPIVFAQCALSAGIIANRILYEGQTLVSFQLTIITLIVLMVLIILGPLVMFTSRLLKTKTQGLIAYGTLASNYTESFDKKWIRGGKPRDEPILGTADIQSLADLANSFALIRQMRPVPFSNQNILVLVVSAALPFAPLLLTIMPFEEILTKLFKVLL